MADENQEKADKADKAEKAEKAEKADKAEAKAAGAKAPAKEAGKKAPAIGPKQLILGGAVVVALAVGTVAGMMLLGPRLAAMRGAAPAAAHEGEEAREEKPAKEKGKGARGKEGEKAVVYRLDNLIVNPAGSHGTRFLMASVAVEVPDARIEAELRDRDFQVRDAVIAVLERQSLDVITAPGGRDSVKARLAETLAPMVGRGVPLHIYLPQFVIQ